MYLAVIELDDSEPPIIYGGPSVDALLPTVVHMLASLGSDIMVDEPNFFTTTPPPQDTLDLDACRAWLDAYREATTEPWVTWYLIGNGETLTTAEQVIGDHSEVDGKQVYAPTPRLGGRPASSRVTHDTPS